MEIKIPNRFMVGDFAMWCYFFQPLSFKILWKIS